MSIKNLALLLLFTACFVGCKQEKELEVAMVYNSTLPYGTLEADKPNSVKDQYYYVYKYHDGDLKEIMAMLDTLSIDTSYGFHSYRFYKYDAALPDTAKLKKVMRLGANYQELQEFPGDSKFYKHQILNFMFVRHYEIDGKKFPDSYSVVMSNKKGSEIENTKYYMREDLNMKLVEVSRDKVSPELAGKK